jgi:hypothetical protein
MQTARLALATCLLAFPAVLDAAEDEPMTAEAFENYSTGKTLFYATGGTAYGAEQYLPGRRVLWAFLGQQCHQGLWYEEAGQICFVYEEKPDPQCWTFYEGPNGLRAQFWGDPATAELIEVESSPDPLICAGPDVGA